MAYMGEPRDGAMFGPRRQGGGEWPPLTQQEKRALVLYVNLNLAHKKLNSVPKMLFKTMKEPKNYTNKPKQHKISPINK